MSGFLLVFSLMAGSLCGRAQEGVSVFVDGFANPWLAGMPPGTISTPNDRVPFQPPQGVAGLPLIPGMPLIFRASGLAGNTRATSSLAGPDGQTRTLSHTNGSENGISDVTAPLISLVGVFLGDDLPTNSAAPSARNFSTAASRNYSVLSPGLKQVIFIGSGTNASGADRKVVVPGGATRLFLGTMDGFEWTNNSGGFSVFVTWRRPATVLTNWATEAGGNGHTYEAVAVSGGVTWSEASRFATNLNGYLACITSPQENATIYALIRDHAALWDRRSSGDSFGPWIGGVQSGNAPEPGGGWGWITGEAMDYTHWHGGEPNNNGGVENRLHYFGSNAPAGDVWNDKNGDSREVYGFVVEYPVSPYAARLEVEREGAGGINVRWKSRVGRFYSVEWTTDIATGPWLVLNRVLGNGRRLTWSDSSGNTPLFYRVIAEP